ncbi:MAG: questin oxidase family protein [Rhodospirillaceae bacterium]|nr:questin oxidase family protein [Rhodospirillaceae bacterium]
MTLIALDSLGASAARLSEFYALYAERLEPLLVSFPGSSVSRIEDCIGRPECFDACRNLFTEEIARDGQSSVLRRWLPALVPGMSASAFHAAIRLAYGIEAGASSEVSSGLAFWVTTYRPLGSLGEAVDENLLEIAIRCSADTLDYEFRPGRIVDRMVELSDLDSQHLARSQPRSISLEDIARFSLRAYTQDAHFTLLHTVTVCHAFRLCLPFLNDAEQGLRYLWQAVLFAYLTTKVQLDSEFKPSNCDFTWPQLLQQAVKSDDEHVIKLTYSAWREHQFRRSARYLCAAGRICGHA